MEKPSAPTSRFQGTRHLSPSSDIFRALAHPLRMQICSIIDDKNPACVNEIYGALNIEQSIASQHLRILRKAKLVHTSRKGKYVYYQLDYDKLECACRVANHFSGYVD
ncbi:MAG: helix-turn-helix transcriptional regulator [Lewinellaceae bacterium]|nr:helix-turn-helix transcriptional regulator [Saprospiraceae bacterium]MCB0543361.1 helix-turn-helix transcriptional regulator [Saprospiraceae bacterium]MCB9306544.1 helix-turn-helix transcriptional regulator [Lewinellaceae bacterium]MCB9355526.1 helix-turn-helix transcriptional regulator [Lewinellaceae bacterium]